MYDIAYYIHDLNHRSNFYPEYILLLLYTFLVYDKTYFISSVSAIKVNFSALNLRIYGA